MLFCRKLATILPAVLNENVKTVSMCNLNVIHSLFQTPYKANVFVFFFLGVCGKALAVGVLQGIGSVGRTWEGKVGF